MARVDKPPADWPIILKGCNVYIPWALHDNCGSRRERHRSSGVEATYYLLDRELGDLGLPDVGFEVGLKVYRGGDSRDHRDRAWFTQKLAAREGWGPELAQKVAVWTYKQNTVDASALGFGFITEHTPPKVWPGGREHYGEASGIRSQFRNAKAMGDLHGGNVAWQARLNRPVVIDFGDCGNGHRERDRFNSCQMEPKRRGRSPRKPKLVFKPVQDSDIPF